MFGLGSFEALTPGNPKIFACIRTYEDDVVLCVHNVARSAQAVELDLSWYNGRRPVEMFGRTRFPEDRRAALPADARPARVLLVPPRGGRRVSLPDHIERPARGVGHRAALVCLQVARGGVRQRARARSRLSASPALEIELVETRFQAGTHELYQLLPGERRRRCACSPACSARRRPSTASPSTAAWSRPATSARWAPSSPTRRSSSASSRC